MTQMRAILIDPFAKTITEVEHNGDWHEIYTHIKAGTFTSLTLVMPTYSEQGEVMYLDDNGLFVKDQRYFNFGDYPQPLAGRALILGVDGQQWSAGETVATKMTLSEVKRQVQWAREDLQYSHARTEHGRTKIAGKEAFVIRSIPIFKTGKEE